MVDVRRVKLPGVGMLHTFVTDDGGKVGVITHRSGHSDLITFADAEDGDARKVSLRLDEDEAHTLAELLGGTRITESLSGLDQIPGLSIDWYPRRLRRSHRGPAARQHDDARSARVSRSWRSCGASRRTRHPTRTSRSSPATPSSWPAPPRRSRRRSSSTAPGSCGRRPTPPSRVRRPGAESWNSVKNSSVSAPCSSSHMCWVALASYIGLPGHPDLHARRLHREPALHLLPAELRVRRTSTLIAIFGLIFLLFNLGLEFDQDEFFGNARALLHLRRHPHRDQLRRRPAVRLLGRLGQPRGAHHRGHDGHVVERDRHEAADRTPPPGEPRDPDHPRHHRGRGRLRSRSISRSSRSCSAARPTRGPSSCSSAISFAFLIGMFAIARWGGKVVSRLIQTKDDELFTILFFGLAVAFGGIGEILGVSDAIGAFLIGLVLGATRYRRSHRAARAADARRLRRVLLPQLRSRARPEHVRRGGGAGRRRRRDDPRAQLRGRAADRLAERADPAPRASTSARSCRTAASSR